MCMGSICETANVFTVQTQTIPLTYFLGAHAFVSLQKLDQDYQEKVV